MLYNSWSNCTTSSASPNGGVEAPARQVLGRIRVGRNSSGDSQAAGLAPRPHNFSRVPRPQTDHASRPPPTIVRRHAYLLGVKPDPHHLPTGRTRRVKSRVGNDFERVSVPLGPVDMGGEHNDIPRFSSRCNRERHIDITKGWSPRQGTEVRRRNTHHRAFGLAFRHVSTCLRG